MFAVVAICSAAGVPCGNVALREVVRGPDAQAVSITTNAAGHAVLDFGKHQFGWLEVDVKKPGPYKIVWGELLDEKGSVQTGRRYTQSEGRIRMCHADWMYTGRPDRIAAHYEAMKTQKLWLNFAREDGLLVTRTKEAEAKGARDIVDWAKCYRDGRRPRR